MLSKFTPNRHEHKHYFSSTKTEFEQLNPSIYGEDIYKRVDYAYLMCNSPCNDIKKVVVKKEPSSDNKVKGE